MSDDEENATMVITDIKAALAATDDEAASKPACLLAVGGELNGTIFDLLAGQNVVGRSPDNQIPLEFNGISRKHFQIKIVSDKETLIEDAGSSNGTFVNNAKIEGSVPLNKGDIIKIGSIALKFLPKGDTERLAYDQLQLEAQTDGMTQCFNKKYFIDRIELEIKKCKVTGNPLSLIFFDLDHFKSLNDNYGHDAGDYVLKEKAKIIRENGIRDGDTFARYGGEEFVVLLPNTNLKQGFEIAERLRKMIEKHDFIYDGQKLPVTASIGIADYRQGIENGTDLIIRSDKAVYQSKKGGRNQVNFFKA
jgi:two-component system cell cycle response regulator